MTSSRGSYLATVSPGFLSHLPIVPSATLSPSWGIVTLATAGSSGSSAPVRRPRCRRQCRASRLHRGRRTGAEDPEEPAVAKVTMPQLGESVAEGTIGKWLKKPGDTVAKYEPLLEV